LRQLPRIGERLLPPLSTWSVGEAADSEFGFNFGPVEDEFWDFHQYPSTEDILTQAGLGGCAATCSQVYYSCGALPLNTFTINYTFTKGTMDGESVTIVGVTKQ
jgi:hypothetical protein